MITCRLKGGIGNMMFQIAFIEYEGKVNKFETGYWNVDSNLSHLNRNIHHNPKLTHAFDYLNIFKNFKWQKIPSPPHHKKDIPFHFETFKVDDNIMYDGFFQSEKYFPDRNFILKLFSPSKVVENKLKKYESLFKENTCSIHIRRGDYLKYDLHVSRNLDYFNQAMGMLDGVNKYLVFSDDIEWCKQTFIGDKFIFIEDEKDYVELFLQSKCNHNIISSSSFSWWGAYLNTNVNKKVIGPKQWFSIEKNNDIIPESWIVI